MSSKLHTSISSLSSIGSVAMSLRVRFSNACSCRTRNDLGIGSRKLNASLNYGFVSEGVRIKLIKKFTFWCKNRRRDVIRGEPALGMTSYRRRCLFLSFVRSATTYSLATRRQRLDAMGRGSGRGRACALANHTRSQLLGEEIASAKPNRDLEGVIYTA